MKWLSIKKILLIGFFIRLVFFLSIQPWNEDVIQHDIIISDAIGYDEMANSIWHDLSFEGMSSYRTPGYPVFLAILYALTSHSIWFVLLIQVIIGTMSVYIIYLLGKRIFSEKAGLVAAFLMAIDFQQALFANTLLTDILFVFLFLSSIYYLTEGLTRKKIKYFVFSGVIMAIGTLVRPITYFLPYLIAFLIVVFWRVTWREKLYSTTILCSVFFLVLSTWMTYNYQRYGKWQLTTLTEYNILYWNAAYTEVYKTGKPVEEVRAAFDSLALQQGADLKDPYSFQNGEIFYELGKDYLRENKTWYIKRHMMGIINLYAGMGIQHIADALHLPYNEYTTQPFANPNIFATAFRFFHVKSSAEILLSIFLIGFMLFNYVFALKGIYVLSRQPILYLGIILLIIAYFSILTGVVGWVRYRLPVMPFIHILCAVGILTPSMFGKSKQ